MAETKRQTISEWVKQWDKSQWEAAEWREFLVQTLSDYEMSMERYHEVNTVCEKQKIEIESLEKQCKLLQRQLGLLQKILDVAERYSRPIVITEQGKKGDYFG